MLVESSEVLLLNLYEDRPVKRCAIVMVFMSAMMCRAWTGCSATSVRASPCRSSPLSLRAGAKQSGRSPPGMQPGPPQGPRPYRGRQADSRLARGAARRQARKSWGNGQEQDQSPTGATQPHRARPARRQSEPAPSRPPSSPARATPSGHCEPVPFTGAAISPFALESQPPTHEKRRDCFVAVAPRNDRLWRKRYATTRKREHSQSSPRPAQGSTPHGNRVAQPPPAAAVSPLVVAVRRHSVHCQLSTHNWQLAPANWQPPFGVVGVGWRAAAGGVRGGGPGITALRSGCR
jgi:hypothetical protein